MSLRRWVEFDWHDEREGQVLVRAELYRSGVGGVIAVLRQTHVLHTVEWNEERQAFDPASGYHGGESTGSGERLSFVQVRSLTHAASEALRQKRDRRGYLEA